jgi:copper ion binding protein
MKTALKVAAVLAVAAAIPLALRSQDAKGACSAVGTACSVTANAACAVETASKSACPVDASTSAACAVETSAAACAVEAKAECATDASACCASSKTAGIVKVQFQVSGMTCTACEKNISNTLAALEGVSETAACAESKSVTVQFDTAKAKEKNLVAAIEKAGYKVERETVQIKVAGLKGADCSNKVSAKLAKLDGVQQQKVCHVGQVAVVTFDPHQTTRDQVIASINDSGFKALN